MVYAKASYGVHRGCITQESRMQSITRCAACYLPLTAEAAVSADISHPKLSVVPTHAPVFSDAIVKASSGIRAVMFSGWQQYRRYH